MRKICVSVTLRTIRMNWMNYTKLRKEVEEIETPCAHDNRKPSEKRKFDSIHFLQHNYAKSLNGNGFFTWAVEYALILIFDHVFCSRWISQHLAGSSNHNWGKNARKKGILTSTMRNHRLDPIVLDLIDCITRIPLWFSWTHRLPYLKGIEA